MTYKEKKLKEFDEEFEIYAYKPEALEFIAKTLDEILGCLPEEYWRDFPETEGEEGYDEGYNAFRDKFLQNLEQKAREV